MSTDWTDEFAGPLTDSVNQPDDASFLVIFCPHCHRDVLTARDLSDVGVIVHVCVHCSCALPAEDRTARWVPAEVLPKLGYFVDGLKEEGCHDEEGGCRGGACGVRQPR